ncbi:MAG: hypothetical protein ACI4I9_06340 [Porcipelethomonas sp.]
MKKIRILSAVLAVIMSLTFTACGGREKESSSEKIAETSEVTEAEETQAEEPETEPETEPQSEGLIIENPVYGYRITAPETINSEDGTTVLNGNVSTADELYIIGSAESDDNLNISVETVISDEEWASYNAEYFQEEYESLYAYLEISTTIEIKSFEAVSVSGNDAYRVELDGKNEDGSEFSQTQIIVNRKDDSAPYCYTFTYTDYTGTLNPEASISSISFTDASGPVTAVDENAGEPFVFDCGAEFTAPEGWSMITDDGTVSHQISGGEAEFTSPDNTSSIYITISETADDEEAFRSYTQQDIESLFSSSFDSFNVNSFKSFNIENYDAHKICYTGLFGDSEFTQTILMINCPDIDKGICIMLSDFSGTADKISETLENTIIFK